MIPILGSLLADAVTALVIEEGTGGDKTKQAARATDLITYASAFVQIFSGSASAGVAALAAQVGSANTDPALAAAITNLVTLLGAQAGLVAQIASGTLVGSVVSTQLVNGLTEMIKVATKFGGTLPTAAKVQAANANNAAIVAAASK
jgi:hypothetical protein